MTKMKANFTFFFYFNLLKFCIQNETDETWEMFSKKQKQNSEELNPTVKNRFMET